MLRCSVHFAMSVRNKSRPGKSVERAHDAFSP
jgi:hypothetical protein